MRTWIHYMLSEEKAIAEQQGTSLPGMLEWCQVQPPEPPDSPQVKGEVKNAVSGCDYAPGR